MAEHTPGPWETARGRHGRTVVVTHAQGGTECVADCAWRAGALAEDEANASLIAAAPDMLAALENLCLTVESMGDIGMWLPEDRAVWDKAEAAIAKARPQA